MKGVKLMFFVGLTLFGFFGINENIFGEKGTFFESVKFIQYLDENIALEEVKKGNLDVYYYRIPSDRLEDENSREGLKVLDSSGGSYSILINPAESEKFNPFSLREVRYAINYLVDRKLVVNELMGGNGAPTISYYGPSDPEYLNIIKQLETFNFRYNPILAEGLISQALNESGASLIDGKWEIKGKPIVITIFIRSDDPVRKSIGEILGSELERVGFSVKKEFGDLNKAFVNVYGSDPEELKWNLYTEGWQRSAFVKYDSVGLAQMYSPWFSNMPGFNNPTYWNYKNEKIDSITQKIYNGDFKSENERADLVRDAINEGISESIRIFVASKNDQYVVNNKLEGVINDFGAGVTTRFTPINSRNENSQLLVGMKQIYQGAWNPVNGFSDAYSRQIWEIISDPVLFKHPFSGETIPVRANWEVETNGIEESIELPPDAIIWDPYDQKWEKVESGKKAISKVRLDFKFSNWHNGQKMDMNDVLHSLYFSIDWGTQTSEEDKTFDEEFTPKVAQGIRSIVGVRIIDQDSIEVFVDYWHFNDGEIAEWAALWSTIPWEISASMEQAVIDGKISFSRSGATSKNINWVSLIIPEDARLINNYLQNFKMAKYIPESIKKFEDDFNYYEERYEASSDWIERYDHAVISNGPFYLDTYSPETRTIVVNAFDDESYPFPFGYWSEFEEIEFPVIKKIQMPEFIKKGDAMKIDLESENTDFIILFLTDTNEKIVYTNSSKTDNKQTIVKISEKITENLNLGAIDLKLWAISDSVLKPDFYSKSLLVVNDDLYEDKISDELEWKKKEIISFWWILPIVILVAIIIYFKKIAKG